MYQDTFSFTDLKYPEFKKLLQTNPVPHLVYSDTLLPFFSGYTDICCLEMTLNYYLFQTNTGKIFSVNQTDFYKVFPLGLPVTQESYNKWMAIVV